MNLTIQKYFFPVLFDGSLSDTKLQLFTLSTCLAGLGVLDPTSVPTEVYNTSKQAQLLLPMP